MEIKIKINSGTDDSCYQSEIMEILEKSPFANNANIFFEEFTENFRMLMK